VEKLDKESIDDVPEDLEGKLKETQQQIEFYKGTDRNVISHKDDSIRS
jgi:hypothetical protein